MTTTEATVTSWRDLTDQLTADQVKALEDDEPCSGLNYHADPTHDHGADLLCLAARYVRDNEAQALYAGMPAPAGATADNWQEMGSGATERIVRWPEHLAASRSHGAHVRAWQLTDGVTEDFWVSLRNVTYGDTLDFGPEEVRAVAAALLACAAELDALTTEGTINR